MRRHERVSWFAVMAILTVTPAVFAQGNATLGAAAPTADSARAVVPRLVKFSGALLDEQGRPMKGPMGVTYSLYAQQSGGAALWMETQNVKPDASGNYTVLLGSASANGIPEELFASGEARWLGVQVEKQPEQPRVLLVSVPYALKAGDAQTLAGRPASDFALAGVPAASASSGSASAVVAGTTAVLASGQSQAPLATTISGGGKTNDIPIWTGSATLGNSVMSQSGGNVSVAGGLQLPSTGTAVAGATGGKNSQPFDLFGSTFNSTLAVPVPQHFRLQEEPVGQSTVSPSGKVSLLYAPGSAALAETGFSINSKGLVSFVPGQTYPGLSVGLSAPASDFKVSGSPVKLSGTLALAWNVAPTSANTAKAIVKRDSSGSFSAGGITALAPGNVIVATMTGNTAQTAAVTGTATASGIGNTYGVAGYSSTGNGVGLFGQNKGNGFGVFALAGGASPAIWGENTSTSGGISDGVHGVAHSSGSSGVAGVNTSGGVGVYGTGGIGIYGLGGLPTGTTWCCQVAVWGDAGGTTPTIAMAATAGNGFGLGVSNNSQFTIGNPNFQTASFFNAAIASPPSTVLEAGGFDGTTVTGTCVIDTFGDLSCTGSKSAIVPVEGGSRKVALYAIEGPENWFEDAGSGQLVNGSAVVHLEPVFAQTVNSGMDYHVFLTPRGECEGLYVANATAAGFEVRELHHGSSSVPFDYRIMAKRKGYENIRLADRTEQFQIPKLMKRPASSAPASVKPALPTAPSAPVGQLKNE